MKHTIVQINDPVLRMVAKAVAKKDIGSPKLKAVLANMRRALAPEENGVAIAAPQIGEPLRIFIVAGKVFEKESEEVADVNAASCQGEREQPPPTPKDKDMVFINPELIRQSRKKNMMSEGCLSVRGVFGTVPRHEKATIRALDEQGASFTVNASGLLAQIFQHEVDHLGGVLFIDKAKHLDEPVSEK